MTLDEMLARESIRHTMSVYNNTGDRGAIDETSACFTQDGILDVGTEQPCGPAAIRAYFQGIVDSGYIGGADRRPTRHHLTTSRIELTGPDSALGWTYFQLVRDGEVLQSGIYVDRFAKVGDRWLISFRRVKVEFDAIG